MTTDPDHDDVGLVLEALLHTAANPDRWEQLVESLAGAAPRDQAPADATRGLAQTRKVAELMSESESTEVDLVPSGLGWVSLTATGKVITANAVARAIMADGLGSLSAGNAPAFTDAHNIEAFAQALSQIASARQEQAVLRLDRPQDEGPRFAYLLAGGGRSDGIVRQPGLTLVFPAPGETERLWASLRESFGLTPAEVRLAAKLREGLTLKEAADDLGLSINTVRNQLRPVFDKMGLRRQSELVRALSDLAQTTQAVSGSGSVVPPVSTLRLLDGRALAYRDYGAPNGRCILFFHEGLGSSLLPPSADAMARRLGARIISVDRPGFGRSDPRADYSFDGVADDVMELCDQLDLSSVRIGAILSGAPSAIQTAIRLGSRVERLIICSGRPPRAAQNPKFANLMTLFRARMENNPWVLETFYAILRNRMSPTLTARMVRRGVVNSPGDLAFIDANPWSLDFLGACAAEALARSGRGPVDELRAFRRAGNTSPTDLACPLVIWHGADDRLAPFSDLKDYLGEHPYELWLAPDTGHLLSLRNWDALMRRLAA